MGLFLFHSLVKLLQFFNYLINFLYTPTYYRFHLRVTWQNHIDYIVILTCLFSEKKYYSEDLVLGVANICNPAGRISVSSYA